MRIAANVCFVLAFIASCVALKIVLSKSPAQEGAPQYAGTVVGAIAVPVILMIIGTVLQKKANRDDG
jgi:uncharacterized membrane protein